MCPKAARVAVKVTEDTDVGCRATSNHRQRAAAGKGACGSVAKEGCPREEELAKAKVAVIRDYGSFFSNNT